MEKLKKEENLKGFYRAAICASYGFYFRFQ